MSAIGLLGARRIRDDDGWPILDLSTFYSFSRRTFGLEGKREQKNKKNKSRDRPLTGKVTRCVLFQTRPLAGYNEYRVTCI